MMRRWGLLSVLGALVCAAPVSAGPLVSAELQVAISTLPPGVFSSIGASGASTGNLAATLAAGSAFAGTYSTTLTTMAAPPLTKITIMVTKNETAAFAGATPGSVGGVGKIGGVAGAFGLGSKLLSIPLSLGQPNTFTKAASGVAITTISAPWTVGTASVTGLGGATPTATAMGMNGLTPGGAGTLVLVTPVRIVTNITGVIAAFGTLELVYVPEPATLALLGMGVAGLAAVGRARYGAGIGARPLPTTRRYAAADR
jgi:hypothetical protein